VGWPRLSRSESPHERGKETRCGELEQEFAHLDGIERGDAKLFLDLAYGALERGFTGVDLASWSVDFTRTDATFFADEEHPVAITDEQEGRSDGRFPACPVGLFHHSGM